MRSEYVIRVFAAGQQYRENRRPIRELLYSAFLPKMAWPLPAAMGNGGLPANIRLRAGIYSEACIHSAHVSWDKHCIRSRDSLWSDAMVSNCANPECGVPLRYLRDGRLFQFEIRSLGNNTAQNEHRAAAPKKRPRQVWHYWLCGACSSMMTLQFDQLRGLKIMPLQHSCSSMAS
jgi:hypothetical protein